MYKSVHYGMSVYLSSLSKCQLSFLFTTFLLVFDFDSVRTKYIRWNPGHSLASVAEKLCSLQPPIQWIFYILETVLQPRVEGWKLNFVCLESQQQQQNRKKKDLTFPLTILKLYSKCRFVGGCALSDEKEKKKKIRKNTKKKKQIVICDKFCKTKKKT